ncbi:hypothetical protein HY636_06380 [Candidatus Woesearchaeota archaeon]|nr:hypothetical protein [Candidatus Woesearchaeota archaeon]
MAWKGWKYYAERSGFFDKQNWYDVLAFYGISAVIALPLGLTTGNNTIITKGMVINERRTEAAYEFTLRLDGEKKDISYVVRDEPKELETLDREINNGDYVTLQTHLSDKGAHKEQTDTAGRIVLKPYNINVSGYTCNSFIIPR